MTAFAFFPLRPRLAASLLTVLMAGCTTAPTNPLIIARDNNTFETVGQGKTRTAALTNAMNNATRACRSQQVIVQDEQTRYNGVVNEQTGRVIEQVGTVVGVLTGNTALGKGIARDDDYEVTVKFYCR